MPRDRTITKKQKKNMVETDLQVIQIFELARDFELILKCSRK